MDALWLERAERGDAGAQFQLGFCYEMGHGVRLDLQAACRWYLRAATQGHSRAQYHLGLACSYGAPGLAWDLAEACKWLSLAARGGIPEAAEALRSLRASPEQRELGEQRAKTFVPQPESPSDDAAPVNRGTVLEALPTASIQATQLQLPWG